MSYFGLETPSDTLDRLKTVESKVKTHDGNISDLNNGLNTLSSDTKKNIQSLSDSTSKKIQAVSDSANQKIQSFSDKLASTQSDLSKTSQSLSALSQDYSPFKKSTNDSIAKLTSSSYFPTQINSIFKPDPVSWFVNNFNTSFSKSFSAQFANKTPDAWVKSKLDDLYSSLEKELAANNANLKGSMNQIYTALNDKISPIQTDKWFTDKLSSGMKLMLGTDLVSWVDKRFTNNFNQFLPPEIAKLKIPDVQGNLNALTKFIGVEGTPGSVLGFSKQVSDFRQVTSDAISKLNSTFVGSSSAFGVYFTGVSSINDQITKRMKVLQQMNADLQLIPVKWKSRADSMMKQISSIQDQMNNDLYKTPLSFSTNYAGYGENKISANGWVNYMAELFKHIDLCVALPMNRANDWRNATGAAVGTVAVLPASYAQSMADNVKETINSIGQDMKAIFDELQSVIKGLIGTDPLGLMPAFPGAPSLTALKLPDPLTIISPPSPWAKF